MSKRTCQRDGEILLVLEAGIRIHMRQRGAVLHDGEGTCESDYFSAAGHRYVMSAERSAERDVQERRH